MGVVHIETAVDFGTNRRKCAMSVITRPSARPASSLAAGYPDASPGIVDPTHMRNAISFTVGAIRIQLGIPAASSARSACLQRPLRSPPPPARHEVATL